VKQKRRQIQGTKKPPVPRLIFTFADALLLNEALIPLEQRILAAKTSLPNVQFALATVIQVQAKMTRMIQQGGWGKPNSFDANEILVLQTAVWLFIAALGEQQPSAERDRLLLQYQRISALLVHVAPPIPTQA
jgi:hypothetical protein